MGPRLLSRGRPERTGHSCLVHSGFNGATTVESWKTGTVLPLALFSSSFNGATTVESWKTLAGILRILSDRVASMGPRLLSRGRHSERRGRERQRTGFNGATTVESWKTPAPRGTIPLRHASMGPRLLSRGRRRRAGV